jgi:putative ABC transport system ATP-binding protein
LTIVLVTHEPEVARFAHRVLRFRDGRIAGDQVVAPEDAAHLLAAEKVAA